jgi:CHAT domain-containing protein
MDPSAALQVLTTADVAMLHVPGSLVVLSGCESGGGEARAGAGLLGLVRAWLAAGAGGVVATLWPVNDTAGDLFPRFYRHLATTSPADALRRAQMEMSGTGAWRAPPSQWAAYQFTGGVR